MRTGPFTFVVVFTVMITGCSSAPKRAVAVGNTRFSTYGLRNEQLNTVPLPTETPFDDDAGARAVFIQAYWEGYEYGLQGDRTIGCFMQGPYAVPKEAGWVEGCAAGYDVFDRKRRDSQK
ncbi:MAG: hypothetical protein AAB380_06785 [Verrucomicrobiota bacterium]